MNINLPEGKYVLALSGGIDSVVLLHLLAEWAGAADSRNQTREVVVAHFDHGIRIDSGKDRKFCESLATLYELPFYTECGQLGPAYGEAMARQARYSFLEVVRRQTAADAIVTAHHQDDLIETAIINLLRGSGRLGLTALQDRPDVRRPLLPFSKAQIISVARRHRLRWREDPSNKSRRYLRNRVRQRLSAATIGERGQWLRVIGQASSLNVQIETIINQLLPSAGQSLDRQWFINLPHRLSLEVMHAWLRRAGAHHLDHNKVEILTVAAKTYRPGQLASVDCILNLQINRQRLALLAVRNLRGSSQPLYAGGPAHPVALN